MTALVRTAAIAAAITLAGCAGQTRYFITNAELLDASAAKASAKVAQQVKNMARGSVAVGEMRTRPDDNDVPQSLINDRLVSDLVKQDVSVIERDRNVLVKMIPEASGKEFSYGIKPRATGANEPLQYEAVMGDREDKDSGLELVRTLAKTPQANVVVGLNNTLPTDLADTMNDLFVPETFAKLPTADFMLAFRVIESGVAYGRTNVTFGEDRLRRKALTLLNYRLVETKTGRVLVSGEALGDSEDEIPAALKNRLAQPLYHHYVHNMPDLAELRGQYTREGVEASLDSRNATGAAILSVLLPGTGQIVVNDRYLLGVVHLALEGFFWSLAMGAGFEFDDPLTFVGIGGMVLNRAAAATQAYLDAAEFNRTWGFAGAGGDVGEAPVKKVPTLKLAKGTF